MTTDQALREAKNRWMRRRRRLIGYGQWQPFVDAAPIREHVLTIRGTGMSLKSLSAATGVSQATLDHLLYGDTNYPPATKIRTESANALLAYWPNLDDYHDGAIIDATGTRRRLQALAAAGWPARTAHQHINFVNLSTIERARFNQQCTARLARAVRDFYNWASTRRPEDHGVSNWVASRCRNAAARQGWGDPTVWDDDTIDDPNTVPDSTGHCGTDRGWWMHTLERIRMCQPCEQAHEEWKAERKHLPRDQYMAAIGAARGAAANREAALAHDARELMRVSGLDYELAAERLGVTKGHLQQAMRRHPDDEQAAA